MWNARPSLISSHLHGVALSVIDLHLNLTLLPPASMQSHLQTSSPPFLFILAPQLRVGSEDKEFALEVRIQEFEPLLQPCVTGYQVCIPEMGLVSHCLGDLTGGRGRDREERIKTGSFYSAWDVVSRLGFRQLRPTELI
ncbi:hypothetical protein RRG08_020500 [Elysia crispata]|uniref:Uncharacterized protein n=1 Tax=Elysia crispata TaxID=231223 RepID=A0AAE1DFU8_9GAST|nr:hypothetical protein RRG08_020500 [Elysia crispata]